MTHLEFIADVYKMLDEGRVEINNQIYYKEQSVLKVMEWFEQEWAVKANNEVMQKLFDVVKNLPTFGEVKSLK